MTKLSQPQEATADAKASNTSSEELLPASGHHKSLTELLTEYRAISRNPELMPKILLLRQIVKLAPAPTPHLKLLEEFETQHLAILTDKAKNAICNHDYDTLSRLQQTMDDPAWTVRPRDVVMAKIHRVLTEAKHERNQKQAQELLEKVNEAYGNFDVERLGSALAILTSFCLKQNVKLSEDMQTQVREAEDYFQQEQKKQAAEKQFQKAIGLFKKELDREPPLEQLEKLHAHITMEGKELPEPVLTCYLQYKETYEGILKRRKLLKAVQYIVAILILVVVCGATLTLWFLRKQEVTWCAKLEESLKQDPTSVTMNLLEDLAKASPYVSKRPKILALAAQAHQKEKEEQQKEKTFQDLLAQIREDLKDYETNRDQLIEKMGKARTLLVTPKDEAEYLQITQELKDQKNAFLLQQNNTCDKLQIKCKDLKDKFDVMLKQHRFNEALDLVGQLKACRDQLILLPGVDEEKRTLCLTELARLDNLPREISERQGKIQKMTEAWQNMKKQKTPQELLGHCDDFVKSFPDSSYDQDVKTLIHNLEQANTIMGKGLNSPYAPEREWLNSMVSNTGELRQAILARAKELQQLYQETPIYTIMFESEAGHVYDLYFIDSPSTAFHWKAMRREGKNVIRYTFNAIINDYGTTTPVAIYFTDGAKTDHDSPRPYQATLYIGPKENMQTLTGTLIYPPALKLTTPKFSQFKVPWMAYYQKLYKELTALSNGETHDSVEDILLDTLTKILEDPFINPSMKMDMAITILEKLQGKLDVEEAYAGFLKKLKDVAGKVPANYHWMRSFQPQAMEHRKQMVKDIQALGHVPDYPSKYNLFRIGMTLANVSRDITPAGVVVKQQDSIRLLGLKAEQGQEGELWEYSKTPPHWHIIGRFSGTFLDMLPEHQERLQHMQLLYTPEKSTNSMALDEKIKQVAEQLGIKKITLPDTWPINQ